MRPRLSLGLVSAIGVLFFALVVWDLVQCRKQAIQGVEIDEPAHIGFLALLSC